jgi:hypothetical protein
MLMTMGWWRRVGVPVLGALVGILCLGGSVDAQSAIAGQVTDATGAVLPGVTVEAASPALIEGRRTAVTDNQGRYGIEALRPGIYKVTFTMQGFSTLIREEVELVSNFTAPINAQLKLGALEESLTVSGQSPLVDVQRTTSQQVLTRDVLDALPTGRNNWAVGMTLPAVTSRTAAGGAVSDVGGLGGGQQAYLVVHGSQVADARVEIDGMDVNSGLGSGNNSSVYFDDGAFQEVTFQTVGGTAESQISGVVVNMIPKDGGNAFTGAGFATYSNDKFYTSNYTDDLRDRGLLAPPGMNRLWDYDLSVGGPIQPNRVWFFSSMRFWGTDRTVPLTFSQPGVSESEQYDYINRLESYLGRLTSQVNPKHKVSAFYNWMPRNRPYINTSAGLNTALSYAPSGTMWAPTITPYVGQAKWTATLTNRTLVEAGYSINHYSFAILNQDFIAPGAIKKVDTVRSTQWNAGDGDTVFVSELQNATAKWSYVTGSHNLKAGFQYQWGFTRTTTNITGDLFQQYQNGRPFQVTVYNTPIDGVRNDLDAGVGLFVQDSWTVRRLTINGGLRWDYLKNSVPPQTSRAGTFVPARTFASVALPTWTNSAPRVGVAYDMFGNARTALKFSYGHYLAQEVAAYAARYNPLGSQTDPRTWTDPNGDDIAQLSEIGQSRNAAFGLAGGRTLADPDLERSYNILYNIGIQHQLFPRMSVSAAYYHRRYANLRWTDNIDTTHANYSIVNIADPRGNGQTIPIYNLDPAFNGRVTNVESNSSQNRMVYNGFDVSIHSRFGAGGTLIAGVSSGLTRSRTCEVDDPNNLRFCDHAALDIPSDKNFKLAGSYPLPWRITASAVFQSVPGLPRNITYVVSRTQVPQLTLSSVTVPLTAPGEEYLPRLNQLDLKFGKTFSFRRRSIQPQLGIFNVTNEGTVLAQNNSFGPTLGRVQSILDGRVVRLSVQVDF